MTGVFDRKPKVVDRDRVKLGFTKGTRVGEGQKTIMSARDDKGMGVLRGGPTKKAAKPRPASGGQN